MAFIHSFAKTTTHPLIAVAIMASSAVGISVPTHADAGPFLQSLEGEWSGDGFYRFEGRQEDERVRCQVSNSYDAAERRLDVNGVCGTAQLKNPIRGSLVQDGNKVSGAMMGALDGSRMTKSTGSIKGNQLVVRANFVDNATGALYRSQQVIHKKGDGFEADFYWYSNKLGQFTKSGTIRFTSR